jgi:hypothetical protein
MSCVPIKRFSVQKRKRLKKRLYSLQYGICLICEVPMSMSDSSFEHILPRSKGGSSHLSNLGLSHISCNSKRGSNSLTNSRLKIPQQQKRTKANQNDKVTLDTISYENLIEFIIKNQRKQETISLCNYTILKRNVMIKMMRGDIKNAMVLAEHLGPSNCNCMNNCHLIKSGDSLILK